MKLIDTVQKMVVRFLNPETKTVLVEQINSGSSKFDCSCCPAVPDKKEDHDYKKFYQAVQ